MLRSWRWRALGVGRHGVDVDATVVGDDGVVPLGVLGAEVFGGDPSVQFEVGFDGFDGAVVVGNRSRLRR